MKSNQAKARVSQLRIIAGEWRSRRFTFTEQPGLRPTPDRVRETLFNWLSSDVPGAHCLDPFTGSGALTLEALSRGAASALAGDLSRDVGHTLGGRRSVRDCWSRPARHWKPTSGWPTTRRSTSKANSHQVSWRCRATGSCTAKSAPVRSGTACGIGRLEQLPTVALAARRSSADPVWPVAATPAEARA